jgi:hypothetical protein
MTREASARRGVEIMRKILPLTIVLLSPLSAIVLFYMTAPAYFSERGFPLDDAWIHATYARSLIRSGQFAYNPGIAAAGETAPLWAIVTSPAYIGWWTTGVSVLLVKLLGFLLHTATGATLFYALVRGGVPAWVAAASSVLVGAHPDLVAASVSGMEVPLATLILSLLLLTVSTKRHIAYGVVSACTFLARPETAILPVLVPAILSVRAPNERGQLLRTAVFGALGAAASALLVVARNLVVTGRPLPSTYYAKVGMGDIAVLDALRLGFKPLLASFAITDKPALLVVLAIIAAVALGPRRTENRLAIGPTMYVAGFVFFAVSFVLVAPADTTAFYHQRYVLPALPLVLAAAPVLMLWAASQVELPERARRLGLGLTFALLLTLEVIPSSVRYARLENDARNIDDVQVQMGKYLAGAPDTSVLWAVDAGATRFFGNAFVVDLVGLNTPAMLTPDAQTYLDAHRPTYVDVFPAWSSLDDAAAAAMPVVRFEAATAYSVTRLGEMRMHLLALCPDGACAGTVTVRGRAYRFACAGAAPGAAQGPTVLPPPPDAAAR